MAENTKLISSNSASSNDSVTLPPPSAGFQAVQIYVAQVLVHRYEVPHETAEQLAAKWEIGRSSDLR